MRSRISEIALTNTIPLSDEAKKCPKIKVMNIAHAFAEVCLHVRACVRTCLRRYLSGCLRRCLCGCVGSSVRVVVLAFRSV